MCEFETPLLLFYLYLPTLVVAFLLGIFVLYINPKSIINRNIFYVILIFWLGTLNSMFQWVVHDTHLNLLLSRLSVFEFLGLLFFTYFTYSFVGKDIGIKKRILLFLPFLPMFFLMFYDVNSFFINRETCSVGYGELYSYMYIVAMFYMAWPIKLLISYSKTNIDDKVRNQISLINKGVTIMVVWILSFVAVSTIFVNYGYSLAENLLLFIPYGLLIFISLLTYAITKYQFLKLKMLSVQALTYAIWILIGSQYFFAVSPIVHVLITITLALSFFIGLALIRSVKEEVKRKEELQKLTEKLAAANEELKRLDSAKTEFISIASHQLRTPLTAIKGFVSLVLEGSYGEVNPKVRDALTKVYTSGERLIHLVEDLLNVSRLESGRMEFKMEKTKIESILHELYDTFILIAKEKKLSLDLKLPKRALTQVDVDIAKIREVLSNLIDNALKYTPKGGVVVKAEMATSEGKTNKAKQSAIATQSNVDLKGKKVLRITVSDTGIGIPASEMPYMFGKFSRGKDTSRLHVGGTGLGLYVGKSIVEAHGGHIWAESEGEGKGTRFIVELPTSKIKTNKK